MRLAIALAAVIAAGTPAAAETWLPVGPVGGDVRSLAIDPSKPNVVYLGTAKGVLYRSEDSGLRWRRLDPGFPARDKSLDNLIVDPRGRILVGFWEVGGTSGGVARSTNGGHNFTLLAGIDGESVRGLAVSAANPDVIVAGAIDGVFRSDDGGDTWRRISPAAHAEIRNVESVAIDPTDPDVIYVGTWHLPWKTLDGGRSWRPTHAGMIADSDVFVMALDHRTPRDRVRHGLQWHLPFDRRRRTLDQGARHPHEQPPHARLRSRTRSGPTRCTPVRRRASSRAKTAWRPGAS